MAGNNSRPDILILMSDQHSKHVLGCYGNSIVRTPNLDRLARDGMRFTDAYCPAPLCVPSRMSFMTCRTPSRNRVWDNGHILSSGIPTWAH
ncbi:MAG: sulfatase-like hydrolase/transferase, partial [Phycisphaerae bacterium]